MLWRCSDIDGYEIEAKDGALGHVDDLLFEEARWTVRWLVVDTGHWLAGRRVLLPPSALGKPDSGARRFPVDLTKQQIEESPPLTTDLPISRQAEAGLYQYYGWTPYWDGDLMPPLSYLSGGIGTGFLFPPGNERREPGDLAAAGDKPRAALAGDPHLRSVGDTAGHAIRASDGDIGHVDDFLVDDDGWRIRYMIADTGNWLPGRKVLIALPWIKELDWAERRVVVDLSRDAVKNSPPYDPHRPLARGYEAQLHGHYGREGYWPRG
jgi:PRC-barrel domain